MAELTRAQPQGMVLGDLYSQVLRTVRAEHEPIRADHLRQHRGVQNPAPRGLQADFRARLGDQPVSLAATPMPACASTTGRSGHSRVSGSTWLGLANGCPAPPVCAITSTPSLAASANIIHLSADDGSTACLTVCSFSATKPSPDTQLSASAALAAACAWCGPRFIMPRARPAVASVMSAIRSCTATGSRAPGNGITSTRSRPWRSVAASTVSSRTSRSNTRQSPRCGCASISTRREYPSSGFNLRAESLPVMLSEALVGWLWFHLCHRETSDTGV